MVLIAVLTRTKRFFSSDDNAKSSLVLDGLVQTTTDVHRVTYSDCVGVCL